MGVCFTKLLCCCKDDYESGWYYSNDSLPNNIECDLDWSNFPKISPKNYPLTDKEIADLYQKEYLYQNRYKM